MAKRTRNSTPLDDTPRAAFMPALQLNGIALQGLERAARQQHAFAGELLDLALRQMQLPTQSGDVAELVSRQAELATQFVAKATQRSQQLVQLAGDQQAQLTNWFDRTAAEFSGAKVKAA